MFVVTFAYDDGDNASYLHETSEACLAEIKSVFDERKSAPDCIWEEFENSENETILHVDYSDGSFENISAIISRLYT